MAEPEEKQSSKTISKLVARFHQLWPRYVPYCGVFGYFTIATNSLHIPAVQQLLSKDGSQYFTNGCLALSHAGLAVYIYHRPSFGVYPRKERLLYSLFGSTLFNLGSILSWTVLQVGLPKDEVGKGLVGFVCGLTYLYIGYRYLRSIDLYILRAYRAGRRKLAEEECEEVKERLERSHVDYEDQELEVDLDDDLIKQENNDFSIIAKVDES